MNIERSLNLRDRGAGELYVFFARWLSGALLALLGTAALVVVVRRLAGALENPLAPAALLGVGVAVATAAIGTRVAWRAASTSQSPSRSDGIVWLGPLLALVALGIALSTSGTHFVSLIAFWLLLAIEEGCAWYWIYGGQTGWMPWNGLWVRQKTCPANAPPTSTTPDRPARSPPPTTLEDGSLPDHVSQQLIRSQEADGTDMLSGFTRVAFAVGQRNGAVHVAFCPPFAETPELTVEQVDGPDARIKMSQILPYGARLDLKLTAQANQPANVLLQFIARSKGDKPESAPSLDH